MVGAARSDRRRRLSPSDGESGTLRSSCALHGSLAHATSQAKLPFELTSWVPSVDMGIDGCAVASDEACWLHLTLAVRYSMEAALPTSAQDDWERQGQVQDSSLAGRYRTQNRVVINIENGNSLKASAATAVSAGPMALPFALQMSCHSGA